MQGGTRFVLFPVFCALPKYLVGSRWICRYDRGQADGGRGAVLEHSGSSSIFMCLAILFEGVSNE